MSNENDGGIPLKKLSTAITFPIWGFDYGKSRMFVQFISAGDIENYQHRKTQYDVVFIKRNELRDIGVGCNNCNIWIKDTFGKLTEEPTDVTDPAYDKLMSISRFLNYRLYQLLWEFKEMKDEHNAMLVYQVCIGNHRDCHHFPFSV